MLPKPFKKLGERQVKLIAGLGNPGAAYQATRHNIGYRLLEYISLQNKIPLQQQAVLSYIGQGTLWDIPVVLAKPLTFMNRSGEAVKALADYYRILYANIIIIHDDLDLPFGQIRIKTRGGSGGHRGIASLLDWLKEDTFIRIRIGIGRPLSGTEESQFVLQAFSAEEEKNLDEIIVRAGQCLKTLLIAGPEIAMNEFHKKIPDA
jgi:PTH1 family peptidyl-tRNA hydrolase